MSDNSSNQTNSPAVTRRDFLKTSAAAAATTASLFASGNFAFAASTDKIRIGLVGCGGRGTGAAGDCCSSTYGVELVAMGDLFKDRLDGSKAALAKSLGDKFKVTDDHCFVGFDAYQKVIDSGIDLVLLTTPPAFRPLHFKAAVEAGKHIFFEKPVAVDPVGVRSILASNEIAKQKKLGVVTGTIYRRHPRYLEIYKRIQDGQIGDIVSAQCYYNTGELWYHDRKPEWSDMEWQCRNWLYFTWLSGDHIVEQHIHNLDVMHWFMGSVPAKCLGVGGRQKRTDPKWGNIYDHFGIEYEFPNGVRVMSMCRQQDNTATRVTDRFVGTKGVAFPKDGILMDQNGKTIFNYSGPDWNPYVKEHTDLIESIRGGTPLNEGQQIAESSLIAIMGRMAAYTGRELSYKWALDGSKLDLAPAKWEFGPLPVAPVAIPGITPLV